MASKSVVKMKPSKAKTTKKGKNKGKKPELRVVRDDDSSYWSDLNRILDLLFEEATKLKMSWAKLAAESGLAETTIYNLGNRWTRRPQFRSIRNLGLAVGMQIVFQNAKAKPQANAKTNVRRLKRVG